MGAPDPTLRMGRRIVEKLRAVMPELSRREAQARVIALLDAVRIPSAAARFHDYPSQFSGGMMRRAHRRRHGLEPGAAGDFAACHRVPGAA